MHAAAKAHRILIIFISLVWIVNGLFCKLLNFVPRHQQIVARILGDQYSVLLTKAIGVAEILMVVWILSRVKSRICAIFQITIIIIMNVIEFIMAPDLLLFGKVNIVVALLFTAVIYINEFALAKQATTKR